MLRVIKEIRPRWVLGENVAGFVNMELDHALADLESEGYETTAFVLRACGVGAPHQRYRVAIVGYTKHDGQPSMPELRSDDETSDKWRAEKSEKTWQFEGTGQPPHESGIQRGQQEGKRILAHANGSGYIHRKLEIGLTEAGKYAQCNAVQRSKNVAHAKSDGLQREWASGEQINPARFETWQSERGGDVSHTDNGSGHLRRFGELSTIERIGSVGTDHSRGTPEYVGGKWWAVEPDVGRVANGVPNRVDRLKCLGNAVVSQQFYPVFQAIAQIEGAET